MVTRASYTFDIKRSLVMRNKFNNIKWISLQKLIKGNKQTLKTNILNKFLI